MDTLYITHPDCSLHNMGSWHPECPDRLEVIHQQLVSSGMIEFLKHQIAEPATDTDILRVHTTRHLDYLKSKVPAEGSFAIDADTLMNPYTLQAARVAAGAGISAVDALMSGKHKTAFCSVRPPGHHAEPDAAMGFCFFNNIAIAAAYALEVHGLTRVAIIDFDVHHGNGSEEAFAGNSSVMMCGVYQYPLYPNKRHEPQAKNMVNVPVQAGARGTDVFSIVTNTWLPALYEFSPQMVFVSAGFDGHREDEMGQLRLVEDDYAWITAELVELADKTAQGRIVSMLEGGYSLPALGRSVLAHVRSLSKLY